MIISVISAPNSDAATDIKAFSYIHTNTETVKDHKYKDDTPASERLPQSTWWTTQNDVFVVLSISQ